MPARKKRPNKSARARAEATQREKDETFFAELAMVCNVTAALKAAGLWRQRRSVYYRRRRDAEYRVRWDESVGESYAMLELEMLERSRHGDNRPAPKTEAERRLRELTDKQALSLLRQHKSGGQSRQPHAQRPFRGEKLRDALEARLSEISRRLGGIS